MRTFKMSESVIVFLEQISEEKAQIFYNEKAFKFEITDPDVIDFFLINFNSLKLIKKGFIEDTQEEFKASGRTSEDYIAKTLPINSPSYQKLIKKFKIHIDEQKNIFNKDSQDYSIKLEKLSHLIQLNLFLMRFEKLVKDPNYVTYTYYIYEEKS